MRAIYCLPVDVIRLFDPTLTQSDITSDALYADTEDKITSYIEDAQGDFDEKTRNPQRLAHAGGGGPESYEYHDAEMRKHQGGIKVWLDHRNVLPFDPAEGDALEIRTTRNDWRDITSSSDRYRLNAADGVLQVFTRRIAVAGRNRRAMINDNIRLKYRHGALGGSRDRSGQTEVAADVTSGDTTIDVENGNRLPRSATVLVGGEYVHYESVDGDTLKGVTRGHRGTSDDGHTTGETVHYCRTSVREGVASKAAYEMVMRDDFVDELVETGDGVRPTDKLERLEKAWEDTKARFSEANMR